jgi:tetratricopeptide (TPR) repeat protein
MEDNTVLYDEILKHGPSQTTLHIVLARIKGEGRVNEVIKWCMVFLRVFPKDIYLRMLLAECYLDLGSVGQAETEFLKVSSMMNDLLPVYAGLARIYAKQKRFKEAAGEAEMFLAHHPDDPEMHEILQIVKQAGDFADEPDEKWPVLPDDEEKVVNFATPTIAELYFSQGQLDAAVETYERVIEEHPDDSVSAERLNQLKAVLEADLPGSTKASHPVVDTQKEKLLTVLEKWLPKVGEIKYG